MACANLWPGAVIRILINTLRPRQDGRRFPDDTFERIFLKDKVITLIKTLLKFVPNGPINNIPALVQIMAWRRPGDKPLSEPMMVRSPTHICVTRPQWEKELQTIYIMASLCPRKSFVKWANVLIQARESFFCTNLLVIKFRVSYGLEIWQALSLHGRHHDQLSRSVILNSLRFIWKLGIRRFHLWVPDLKMN